jgi:uncharacterized protein (TIGR02246 family)
MAAATRQLVAGELAAVNRQDPAALADHFSEDCEFVDLSDGTSIQGRAAFLEDLRDLFARVPDLHVVESRLVADGERLLRERMYYDAARLDRQLAGQPT